MKTVLIILIFLLIGVFFIIAEENIRLNSKENIVKVSDLYFKWLAKLAANTESLSGYVIKMEWLPEPEEKIHVP